MPQPHHSTTELNDVGVFVDTFESKHGSSRKHFFLTHCHADHLHGLNASFRRGFIYCTPPTADFIITRIGVDAELVKPVQYDESVTVELEGGQVLSVTVFDACHCIGSCMFLFEGRLFRILHTGDFRWDEDMYYEAFVEKYGDRLRHIDMLYFDNTCKSPHAVYPSRAACANVLVEALKLYPEETKFLVTTENVGKEELLQAMAVVLKTKVVITEKRMELICKHGEAIDPAFFTTNKKHGRIYTCRPNQIKDDQLETMNKKHGFRVLIRCSALATSPGKSQKNKRYTTLSLRDMEDLAKIKRINDTAGKQELPRKLYIPYTLHTSYPELARFVKFIQPREVSPFAYQKDEHIEAMTSLNIHCKPCPKRKRELEVLLQKMKSGMLNEQPLATLKKPKRSVPSKPWTAKEDRVVIAIGWLWQVDNNQSAEKLRLTLLKRSEQETRERLTKLTEDA